VRGDPAGKRNANQEMKKVREWKTNTWEVVECTAGKEKQKTKHGFRMSQPCVRGQGPQNDSETAEAYAAFDGLRRRGKKEERKNSAGFG